MRTWMEGNPRRNSKRELVYNCTGHQSVMIVQSVPYCLQAAANVLQEYEINEVIKYIEKNLCDADEFVTSITVDIHWADDDLSNNDDQMNNDNDNNHDEMNNHINDSNNDKSDSDVNVNTGEMRSNSNENIQSNVDVGVDIDIADLQTDISSVDLESNNHVNVDVIVNSDILGTNTDVSSVDLEIGEYIHDNNASSQTSSASTNEPDWLDNDILKDSSSELMSDSQSESDAKQEILPDIGDVITNQNDDETMSMQNGDAINDADLGQYAPKVKSMSKSKINYHYRYKVSNCDKEFLLDNNDNKCGIKYSRTFNLAAMFDYCSLFRKVFSVFATLKWPKNDENKTPHEIKMSQLWGRSAIYKARLLSRWLLHDYAMLAGGVGGYMLEAFWHYNPDGYGFYMINQQMVEHWGHWMKKNRSAVGDGEGNAYLYEIADNYDINILGRVMVDMVDFSDVVHKEKLRSVDVFDLEQNDSVEKNALNQGPIFWQMVCNSLSQIQVNDDIWDYIYELGEEDKNEYTKLSEGLKESLRLSRENQANFEANYDDASNQERQQQQWQSNLQNVDHIREEAQRQSQPQSRKDKVLKQKQKSKK